MDELKSNPRLRLGLAAIVGLLGTFGIFALKDRVDALDRSYRADAAQMGRWQGDAKDTVWQERAEQALGQAMQLESKVWQAKSPGLAQAAWQDALTQMLARVAAVKPVVVVTPAAQPAEGNTDRYLPMKAKVEFEFAPDTLYAWLKELSKADKAMLVDVLVVRKEPIPRVEAQLVSYLLSPNAGSLGGSQ